MNEQLLCLQFNGHMPFSCRSRTYTRARHVICTVSLLFNRVAVLGRKVLSAHSDTPRTYSCHLSMSAMLECIRPPGHFQTHVGICVSSGFCVGVPDSAEVSV